MRASVCGCMCCKRVRDVHALLGVPAVAVLALRGGKPSFGRTPACPPDGFTETLLLQR